MYWNTELTQTETEIVAQKYLAGQPGLEVLSTAEWVIPFHRLKVEYEIGKYRKYNLIEEFILKCLASGIEAMQQVEGMQCLLGLDEVFIVRYLDDMVSKGIVTPLEWKGYYKLLEKGNEALKTGLIPSTPRVEQIDLIASPQFGVWTTNPQLIFPDGGFHAPDDRPCFRYYNQDADAEAIAEHVLSVEEVVRIAKEQDKGVWVADVGDVVDQVRPPELVDTVTLKFGEIWVRDIVDDRVYCRVWDFHSGVFAAELEEFLNVKEAEQQRVNVISDNGNSTGEELKNLIVQQRNSDAAQPSRKYARIIETLRGADIRAAFLQAFEETKRRILIVTPWISETVVDEKLIARIEKLARRQGSVFIGWGIASELSREDRKPQKSLLDRLADIKNSFGLQAVFVYYIGNHHNKEIIVDSAYHMLGSFNWLSYRGEYSPRNESVNRIFDEDHIKEQTEVLEAMFLDELEKDLPNRVIAGASALADWFNALLSLTSCRDRREKLALSAINSAHGSLTSAEIAGLVRVYARNEVGDTGLRQLVTSQNGEGIADDILEALQQLDSGAYRQLCALLKMDEYGHQDDNGMTKNQRKSIKKKKKKK